MKNLPMFLMSFGALIFLAGAAFWVAQKLGLPIGRLPGDIHAEGRGWSINFPVVTCIILSLILTLLLNFFLRR